MSFKLLVSLMFFFFSSISVLCSCAAAPVQPDRETGGRCGRCGRYQIPPLFCHSGVAQIDSPHCGKQSRLSSKKKTDRTYKYSKLNFDPLFFPSHYSHAAPMSEFCQVGVCSVLISLSHLLCNVWCREQLTRVVQ